MIGGLRRRVFWSIFLSAGGVLLAILLAINALRLIQTASKIGSVLDSALSMRLMDDGADPMPEGDPMPGGDPGLGGYRGERDRAELLRSVSGDELGLLVLNADGSVAETVGRAGRMGADSEDVVSAVADAALKDADGRGRADGWEYKTLRSADGVRIAFLNAASLRREDLETALLSLAGLIAACGLFALLALELSRAIVRPVEENVRMQKRFVADASHELKTPLTVIDANASVLEGSVGPNKWLGYIKEQTGRMSGLVNELLQLANLEESAEIGAPHPREAFDAAEAVMAAALPFESVAFERGVTLETDVPDALEARGSRKDLEQLAAILIDNAVKHSAQGAAVRVALSHAARRHGRREKALQLRVVNSGDGIPPEALPHVFDRFYRVDEARAHTDNGYGLGLAIAKGLAERNGGDVAVTSQNGVTEFTLTLPIE